MQDDCVEIGLVNNMPDAALRIDRAAIPRSARGGVRRCRHPAASCTHCPMFRAPMRRLGLRARQLPRHRGAVGRTARRPDRHRHGAARAVAQGRAILGEPDEAHRLGRANTGSRGLVVPRRARGGAAYRRHRAPSLAQKRFGLFECTRRPSILSRGVRSGSGCRTRAGTTAGAEALARAGYSVLTRSAEAGVDTFVKQKQVAVLFFQGHPEYEGARCCANIAATSGVTCAASASLSGAVADLFRPARRGRSRRGLSGAGAA